VKYDCVNLLAVNRCVLTRFDLQFAVCAAGITPAITNEVGVYVEPNTYDIATLPRNTRVNAHKMKRIKDRRNRPNNTASIAVPNDRPRSVRPTDRNEQYESVFRLFCFLIHLAIFECFLSSFFQLECK